MDDNLHHPVNSINTNWGISEAVTVWCNPAMNRTERTAQRRAELKKIVDHLGLSVVATKTGKPASQINDMIAGRKSFGEQVARELEQKLGLAPLQFDAGGQLITDAIQSVDRDIVVTPHMLLAQISGLLKPMGLKLNDVVQDREATLRHLAARLAGQDELANDIGSVIAQTALTGGDKRGKRRSAA